MYITPEDIHNYASRMSTAESEVLKKLNRNTHARVLRPRMLSGHLQGRFLELISRLKAPRVILEIGTYTGYSAICLAQGLAPGGVLHTIDHNPELEDFSTSFFNQAGLSDSIRLHVGEALDIIPTIEDIPELVFIDADKENYIRYFDLVIERMPRGGIILADNVLWSGKVLEPAASGDKETLALQQFNEYVAAHPAVTSLLLPFRDGLMILEKV
ncbi:MAG: O-methyltransferase [Bacteroidales bacterium]